MSHIVLGTLAVEEPAVAASIARRWPGQVLLGLDARNGEVRTRGWIEGSGRTVESVLADFETCPLAGVIHTEVSRDGMLEGPDLPGLQQVMAATRHPVIASGGIASLDDVIRLSQVGVAGAIVGRVLYEGGLDLAAAIAALRDATRSA